MMKKLLQVLVLTMFVIGCNSVPEGGFRLEGKLKGEVKDSTQVYLKTLDSTRNMVDVDTAYIAEGNFSFEGKEKGPQLYYLFFQGIPGNAQVIVEEGSLSFSAQKDSLAYSKLGGTPQNEMFMDYLTEIRRFSEIGRTFNRDLRLAQQNGDQATMQSLREEYLELQEKSKDFEKEFITNNPSSLISVLILERIAAQKALPFEEIDEMAKNLSPEIKNTPPAKRLMTLLANLKATAIGQPAPEFSGPTPNGDLLALNDVKGKVTLIDFWAGWCKPCRMENPNIVSVYEKYKDKGLEVVGVSLDRQRDQWLNAIQEDNLQWNHVSNVQYFQDPIARLYQVNAIPAAFLLDENGVIVAKNLRGPALEAKVAELLN